MLTIVLCGIVVGMTLCFVGYGLVPAARRMVAKFYESATESLRTQLESQVDTVIEALESQKAELEKLRLAVVELQGRAMQPNPEEEFTPEIGTQWSKRRHKLENAKKVEIKG